MDRWLKIGSLKEKEAQTQDQLQDNNETEGAASTTGSEDKLQ
jgi:hypothetical protein